MFYSNQLFLFIVFLQAQANAAAPAGGGAYSRMPDFLSDAAERIMVMNAVHDKVQARYSESLDWLGIPPHFRGDYRVHTTCKILSEFALEYRTTRERVIQTIQKKKAAREKKRMATSRSARGDER